MRILLIFVDNLSINNYPYSLHVAVNPQLIFFYKLLPLLSFTVIEIQPHEVRQQKLHVVLETADNKEILKSLFYLDFVLANLLLSLFRWSLNYLGNVFLQVPL